ALIFAEPDFLLLDEPTNNLDREGRAAVIDLLADWRGGAIIVSPDEASLNAIGVSRRLDLASAQNRRGIFDAERRTKCRSAFQVRFESPPSTWFALSSPGTVVASPKVSRT
ncbi:hypothetical protein GR328_20630, partial [Microvirga makkahensis]|nr:hypothetical protein [Microvirga makkahensis]